MKTEKENPITVYISGAFGVHKEEGFLLSFGTDKYAQYERSPFVRYIQKGKRKPTGCRVTSHPYLLVLKGHGYPGPADPFIPVERESVLTCTKSRYSSFDDRYKTDFDQVIKQYAEQHGLSEEKFRTIFSLMDIRDTIKSNYIADHAMRKYEDAPATEAPVLKQYDY